MLFSKLCENTSSNIRLGPFFTALFETLVLIPFNFSLIRPRYLFGTLAPKIGKESNVDSAKVSNNYSKWKKVNPVKVPLCITNVQVALVSCDADVAVGSRRKKSNLPPVEEDEVGIEESPMKEPSWSHKPKKTTIRVPKSDISSNTISPFHETVKECQYCKVNSCKGNSFFLKSPGKYT